MNFFNIIIKNMRFNLKNQIEIILCNFFNASAIYIFSVILFNNQDVDKQGIKQIIIILYFILLIFSFLFMRYSIIAYMESRSREFALYLSLGISKDQIIHFITIENIVTAVISTIMGILVGIQISSILDLIVGRISVLQKLSFKFNKIGLLFSLVIIFVLYINLIFYSIKYVRKNNIIQLFKGDEERDTYEGRRYSSIYWGIAVIVMAYLSMVIALEYDLGLLMPILSIIIFLIGIHLLITNAGIFIYESTKKNKRRYYKTILHTMDIYHKFKQYKRVLYLAIIANGSAIFLIGIVAGVYQSDMNRVIQRSPYESVVYWEDQVLHDDMIQDILTSENNEIKATKYFQCKPVNQHDTLITNRTANHIKDVELAINKGHTVIYGHIMGFNNGDIISIPLENGVEIDFVIDDIIKSTFCNEMTFAFIINEEDYDSIKTESYNIAIIETSDTSDHQKLYNDLDNYSKENKIWINMSTKHGAIEYQKATYAPLIFMLGIIAVIFFICSSIILYLKTFTGLDIDREKYKKLSYIGIKKREITIAVKKELSILFSMPLLFGGLSAYLWIIVIMCRDTYFGTVAFYSGIFVIVYILIQGAFYYLTKRNYIKKLLYSRSIL